MEPQAPNAGLGAQDIGNIGHDIKNHVWHPGTEKMSVKIKVGGGPKPGEREKTREGRLAHALRANLLKRKAQVRERASSKSCDDGGQGKS